MNELDASRKQKQIGKSAEMPRLLTGCKVMREHVTAVNPEGRKGSPRDERKVALLSLCDGSTTRRVDITWTSHGRHVDITWTSRGRPGSETTCKGAKGGTSLSTGGG